MLKTQFRTVKKWLVESDHSEQQIIMNIIKTLIQVGNQDHNRSATLHDPKTAESRHEDEHLCQSKSQSLYKSVR